MKRPHLPQLPAGHRRAALVIVLVVVAMALATAGVAVVAGAGWALIASGCLVFALAKGVSE